MRVLLDKKSRKFLFEYLKKKNDVKTYKQLAKKKGWSFFTTRKWRNAEFYLPLEIIPKEIKTKVIVIDEQKNNWGQVKGGRIGGVNSVKVQKEKYGEEKFREMRKKCGTNNVETLWRKYGKEKLTKMCIEGKFKKRKRESLELEKQNLSFFANKKIRLKKRNIEFGCLDIKRNIKFPSIVSKELAEETGAHLGDGCMSKKKNYFSIKTNKPEKGYITYLSKIYKKIYNIDLKLKEFGSVFGFEIYSKALCEFKNKVLGLPYGEKIHKIEIPKPILDTKSKKVYCSLIRGLFDTDGCLCIIRKNNKNYPIISITIKSEKLIQQAKEMLELMGFIPYSNNKSCITLSGYVMLNKWIKEIGSNNPKNIYNLQRASSITG